MVKTFISSPQGTNTYLLISDGEAAVIDPAHSCSEIKKTLDELGDRLKYILVTHAHLSHVHAVPMLKKDTGGRIGVHPSEMGLLKEMGSPFEPDLPLNDHASLNLGSARLTVLHTPGHTLGSVCFYVREAKALFTGDTLLQGEFGRIWGPHSMGLMVRSLKRLNRVIPPKTTIYPGHGPMTTLSKEAWLDGLDNLS